MVVTLYPSPKHYVGFATQTAQGSPAAAPTLILPIIRSGTSLEWMTNAQEVDEATGDYFVEVDSIPQEPHSEIKIRVPFRPTQLNPLLAACCMPGGALIPPVPCTFFDGGGVDEDIYPDCFCAGVVITIPSRGQCTLDLTFQGLTVPTQDAYRTVTFPNYERPYLHSDLQPATLISNTPVNRFDTVTITMISKLVLEYLTLGTGVNEASDAVLNQLGASIDFKVAYISALQKTAFLAQCNTPGAISFQLATSCSGTPHSHTFAFTNGVYNKRQMNAPDNAYIDETLTARALRNTGASPAPFTVTIV